MATNIWSGLALVSPLLHLRFLEMKLNQTSVMSAESFDHLHLTACALHGSCKNDRQSFVANMVEYGSDPPPGGAYCRTKGNLDSR